MTGLDIEAIRARADQAAGVELTITRGAMSDDAPLGAPRTDITPGGARALWLSSRDVPVLLEHLERDRAALDEAVASVREQEAEIGRLRAELLEEQTVHAKTMDNFEAESESWLNQQTHLLDRRARLEAEVARVRGWNDEIKAERDALALAALDHEGSIRKVTAERDEALQVIADLQGGTP